MKDKLTHVTDAGTIAAMSRIHRGSLEVPLILGLAVGNSIIMLCASRGRRGRSPSAAQSTIEGGTTK